MSRKGWIVASVLSFVAMLSPLSAVDCGGQFSVKSGDAGHVMGQLDFLTTAKMLGWIDVPFNDDCSSGFSAQVSGTTAFELSYDKTLFNGIFLDMIFDIDHFRFFFNQQEGKHEGFDFSLGRFKVSDKTGVIFNQNCDGAYLGYTGQKVLFNLYMGYTGLLNSKTNLIINSKGKNFWSADYNELYSYVKDKYEDSGAEDIQDFMGTSEFRKLMFKELPKQMYTFADAYYVSQAAFTFPYLFANQTVYLEGSMFISIEGPSKMSKKNHYNRFYATAGLFGPLFLPNLTYSLTETISTSSFVHISSLSLANLTYYTGFKDLTFSLDGLYASGKDNYQFDDFHAFTSQAVSYRRYGQEYTGVIKGGISASIKPLDNFLITAGLDRLYSYDGKVVKYSGWQEYTQWKLQCTTDFQVAVRAYRYYGADSLFNNAGATVYVCLNF